MKILHRIVGVVAFGLVNVASNGAQGTSIPAPHDAFETSLQRFGITHNREELTAACEIAIGIDSSYALPRFYLGVLDEADEKWSAAIKDFNDFLLLEKDSDLSAKARRELAKLPILIKEDSTISGKLNRQYRQHLVSANLLFKQGFAREALLDAAEAAKLLPHRWEAYAVASNLMLSQHRLPEAKHFLALTQQYLPKDEAHRLDTLAQQIERQSNAVP